MIEIVLVVLLILGILTFIMFLFLSKMIKNLGKQSKEFFVLKLQDYDDLVLEKEKKLKEMEEEEKEDTDKDLPEPMPVQEIGNVVVNEKERTYQIEDLLSKVKNIDETFKVDERKIILEFLETKVSKNHQKVYEELVKIKKEILKKDPYQIMSNSQDYFKNILENASEEVRKILSKYGKKNISLNKLLGYLDLEISKNNPYIYIYVGDKYANYDNYSSYIKTRYSPKIYKGIKIVYQNRLYDYSI